MCNLPKNDKNYPNRAWLQCRKILLIRDGNRRVCVSWKNIGITVGTNKTNGSVDMFVDGSQQTCPMS